MSTRRSRTAGSVPGKFREHRSVPIWAPLPIPTGQAYAEAATYGEQIRAELAANNPALLVLDREFETQSVDPMFLEPESGLAWYDAGRKNLELVLGVQSPYEAAECDRVSCSATPSAAFKPARINTQFRLLRRRIRRTRPHAVPALRRVGGDVLSRIVRSGSPTTAIEQFQSRNQAARLQDAHADRGRSRDRQDRRIRRRPRVGWRRPRQFFGQCGDRRAPTAALGIYYVPKVDVTTFAFHSRGVTAGSMRGYGTAADDDRA